MKKKVLLCAGVLTLLCGCAGRRVIEPNGSVEYFANVNMAIDETDPYVYAGTVDYIFAGTVDEVVKNVIDLNNPYSSYRIHVDQNLKGSLQETVLATKAGGLNRSGTLLLLESDKRKDTGLPEAGKSYVFMAYGQKDGGLLLSEFLDDRPCSEELINEYLDYIDNEVPFDRERYPSKYETEKEKLEIGHRSGIDYEDVPEPEHVSVNITVNDLPETEWQDASFDIAGEELKAQIMHDYPDLNPEGWQMLVHYYNDEKTAGILQFRYRIGNQVITDRAVSCSVENGVINDLYYTAMDGEADEQAILESVRKFKADTVQEKYELKENETFLEETVDYNYYYRFGKLVYVYNLFFEEPEGVINNEIVSEYVIEVPYN